MRLTVYKLKLQEVTGNGQWGTMESEGDAEPANSPDELLDLDVIEILWARGINELRGLKVKLGNSPSVGWSRFLESRRQQQSESDVQFLQIWCLQST